jgi:hypothetical protein
MAGKLRTTTWELLQPRSLSAMNVSLMSGFAARMFSTKSLLSAIGIAGGEGFIEALVFHSDGLEKKRTMAESE